MDGIPTPLPRLAPADGGCRDTASASRRNGMRFSAFIEGEILKVCRIPSFVQGNRRKISEGWYAGCPTGKRWNGPDLNSGATMDNIGSSQEGVFRPWCCLLDPWPPSYHPPTSNQSRTIARSWSLRRLLVIEGLTLYGFVTLYGFENGVQDSPPKTAPEGGWEAIGAPLRSPFHPG